MVIISNVSMSDSLVDLIGYSVFIVEHYSEEYRLLLTSSAVEMLK
jgi:hypothetical protein